MVADCTDYETYRSGNYVPGIMGTIFSLVDKVISSERRGNLVNGLPGLHSLFHCHTALDGSFSYRVGFPPYFVSACFRCLPGL